MNDVNQKQALNHLREHALSKCLGSDFRLDSEGVDNGGRAHLLSRSATHSQFSIVTIEIEFDPP